MPFIMAMLKQESNLKHYNEPSKNDEDTYIVIGLDTNANEKHIITSRGYGAGQYTLFHHPPRVDEVEGFMLDVEKNLNKAVWELKYKFDHFVNGDTTGTRADDRIAEHGEGPLRMCKHPAGDPKYMKDCKQCMIDAGQQNIQEGVTRLYRGSKNTFEPSTIKSDYEAAHQKCTCDWPYAARYNDQGNLPLSNHHLKNLLLLKTRKTIGPYVLFRDSGKAMKPDKVIITNMGALKEKYAERFGRVEQAIQRLIAADKKRGLDTKLVAIDSASDMSAVRAEVVKQKDDQGAVKKAVDAVFDAYEPDYIMILGLRHYPHQT
jgi:hypothetical protein